MTREQIEKLEALTDPVLERSLGLGVPQSIRRLLAERARLIAALRPFVALGTDSMTYRKVMAEWGMSETVKHTDEARAALAYAEGSA